MVARLTRLDTMTDTSLVALDRAHLIHPVSDFRAHERTGPIVLASGRGAYLRDSKGREYLDAFAGLWCVNVGYGQESVVQAAAEQMAQLPYATAYFDFALRAGDPPGRATRRTCAGIASTRLFHAGWLRCSRLGGAFHHPLLQLDRPAAAKAVHSARARIPWIVRARLRADCAPRVPRQLRCAATGATPHSVAIPIPEPGWPGPASHHRLHRSRRCVRRWRHLARTAWRHSSASRSRVPAA